MVKFSQLISRVLFAFVGGFFKQPLLYTLGLFGICASIIANATSFIDQSKAVYDVSKVVSELLKASVGLFLYVRSNIVAWKNEVVLRQIVERMLEDVRAKLGTIGIEISWTKKGLKKISRSLYPKWANQENWSILENDFVDLVDLQFLKPLRITEGQRLFAQYVLYDLFPLSRTTFLSKLTMADLSPGSARNEFVSLFDAASKSEDIDLRVQVPILSLDSAQLVFDRLSTGSLKFFKEKLATGRDREALIAVAEQCLREGYTSIDQILKFRREGQPFKMLLKYDERFAYLDRTLKALAVRDHPEEKAEELVERAMRFLNPYPFSHALDDFDNTIVKLLPRDPFVYVFDLNQIRSIYGLRDPDKFMMAHVIPLAKEYHQEGLKKIRLLDNCFKKVEKDFVANYYIIDIDIETIVVRADNKAIPEGIKRILVQDVAAHGDLANLLTSQELYLRKIIESMPLDALLFKSEVSPRVREFLRVEKRKIHSALKKVGVASITIGEKKEFANKLNKVVSALLSIKSGKRGGIGVEKEELRVALQVIADNSAKLEEILKQGITIN